MIPSSSFYKLTCSALFLFLIIVNNENNSNFVSAASQSPHHDAITSSSSSTSSSTTTTKATTINSSSSQEACSKNSARTLLHSRAPLYKGKSLTSSAIRTKNCIHMEDIHNKANSVLNTVASSYHKNMMTTISDPPSSSSISSSISSSSSSSSCGGWLGGVQRSVDALPLVPLTRPCFETSRDSSYTRVWTNADWERHLGANSFWRYFRHVTKWYKSTTARAVLPSVLFALIWCGAVALCVPANQMLAESCKAAASTLLAPILLLLTLRTNRALDRVLEARRAWGALVRASKSIISLACSYTPATTTTTTTTAHSDSMEEEDKQEMELIVRYLVLFGWTLKASLRSQDATAVISTLLPQKEAMWLIHSPLPSKPYSIIVRLRHLLRSHEKARRQLEDRLCELETSIGICHRMLGSPIPPTYTRHTSRILALYIGILPFAFLTNKNWNMFLTTALLSYVLVGIDEIGVEIEHPFPLLPMQQLCMALQRDIIQIVNTHRNMPT